MAKGLDNFFRFFGRDANPALVAMGIAGAKAICRPTFTLMDKKQEPKSKRYAALREGLTEIIAIGVYWGSGKLAELCANKYIKAKEGLPKDLSKDVFQNILKETNLPENIDAKKASEISKNFFKANSIASMIGVFLSALIVIPAVCSLVIKPLMKVTNMNNDSKTSTLNNGPTVSPKYNMQLYNDKYKNFNTFSSVYSNGMKVGSV